MLTALAQLLARILFEILLHRKIAVMFHRDTFVQNQDPAKASTSAGAGTKEPVIDGTSSKVTEAVRAKHEQQQKILDSNEPLTDSEIAEARSLLLQHLLPREKVMQALARLSSERATNDSKIVRNLDALPYSSCSKAKQTLTATLLSTVRLVPAPFDKRKLGRHRSCEHRCLQAAPV